MKVSWLRRLSILGAVLSLSNWLKVLELTKHSNHLTCSHERTGAAYARDFGGLNVKGIEIRRYTHLETTRLSRRRISKEVQLVGTGR
jgi:hypothetical protein